VAAVGRGRVALALGLENGAPLGSDPHGLEHFHARGIRYVTLTHARPNQICDSSYAEERPWNGLSAFGHELIPAMNAMGMMIDVSHVSDAAFEQVVDLSSSPVVATHSSCRHFTPGWERNLSDEMIRALASTGGLMQVTFGSSFLRDDYRLAAERLRAEVIRFCEGQGVDEESPEAQAFLTEQKAVRPLPLATVEHVVDHIDHVVGLVGIEHVGLGSDFDGVGDSTPLGLRDVSGYPNLLSALLRRGYTLTDMEKICAGNLLRVWREIEAAPPVQEDSDG
jgi:membrane dipeptidase